MTYDADIAIVGAGIIGLALARALAPTQRVIVLEKNARIADETSSRNSGVIHAGIYYPSNSLKTRLCVRGNAQLYDYCATYGVTHQRCGKLIVASSENEIAALKDLQQQALKNGVALAWWDKKRIAKTEPTLNAVAALHSPSTGIVDASELAQQLAADAQARGADIAMKCSAQSITAHDDGFTIATRSGDKEYDLRTRYAINAAGLHAQTLARQTHGLAAQHIPPLHLCKGDYFRLRKGAPFAHLIYPVVDKNAPGLGIHATLDLQGNVRFGPDAEYTDAISYAVDDNKRAAFAAAISRYFPAIRADDLEPDYAGMRPKLQAPGAPFCDFVISTPQQHSIRGLINLFGIESPGLTAALAIAEHIATQLS